MSDVPPPAAPVVPPVLSIPEPAKRSYTLLAAVLLAQLPIMILVGYLSTRGFSLVSLWAVVGISMLVFMMALGDARGRIGGVLISERNVMSLSRFQVAAWTLLICSAFITIALARVFANANDPLAIRLPAELWQLLGISGASSVGAALVIQQKTRKTAAPGEMERAGAALNEAPRDVAEKCQGIVYANSESSHAHFTDMFEGDEVANTAYIDMSKVQMFFFTLVTLVAYGAQLANLMADGAVGTLNSFPELTSGLVALLGISHATYLGAKAVDRTKTT